jgi:RNA polymerase sigma-70 factor (ECF subfamily)
MQQLALAPKDTDPHALVVRAQAGDVGAFEALYRHHVGRVYALCLRATADPSRAESLTQDAFVRAWQRLGSFRAEAAFSRRRRSRRGCTA